MRIKHKWLVRSIKEGSLGIKDVGCKLILLKQGGKKVQIWACSLVFPRVTIKNCCIVAFDVVFVCIGNLNKINVADINSHMVQMYYIGKHLKFVRKQEAAKIYNIGRFDNMVHADMCDIWYLSNKYQPKLNRYLYVLLCVDFI